MGRNKRKESRKPWIVMIDHNYFPLERMMANHKRFFYLAKGLKESFRVLIVCSNNKFSSTTEDVDGMTVLRVPHSSLRGIRNLLFVTQSAKYLKRYLAEHRIRPAAVWYNNIYSFKSAQVCACPRIWDVMGLQSKEVLRDNNSLKHRLESMLYRKMENKTLQQTTHITTINAAHRDALRKRFDGPIEIIRDGVDPAWGAQNGNRTTNRAVAALTAKRFVVFYAGSFGRRRLDDLFSVLPRIIERIPHLLLIIAGEGPLLKEYRAMSKIQHMDQHIHFTGYLDSKSITPYLRQAHVCYADTFLDGFPFKIFEYALFGKPTVVKDTNPIREVLTNARNAVFYRTSRELVDAFVTLSKDRGLRNRIGQEARRLVLAEHTWANRVEHLTRSINEISQKA